VGPFQQRGDAERAGPAGHGLDVFVLVPLHWLQARSRHGCAVKLSIRSRAFLPPKSSFARFRFPAEAIVVAVRWYLRYNLSYRDVEELLVERGVEVDHVTVYRWVQRFTPLLADAARFARHSPGDRWFVDETYVKVNGVWRCVSRHRPARASH